MSTTRPYEITYIVDPSLSDDARTEIDGAVDTAVTAHGTITQNTETLRRRLAYPINKQHVGFLRMLQADLTPDSINQLEQNVRKMKGVLRVSVLQTTERDAVTPAIFDNVKRDAGKREPEPAAAASPTPAKSKKEVTMEEVEEKIEKALEEEVK